jgi:hypothetical protein
MPQSRACVACRDVRRSEVVTRVQLLHLRQWLISARTALFLYEQLLEGQQSDSRRVQLAHKEYCILFSYCTYVPIQTFGFKKDQANPILHPHSADPPHTLDEPSYCCFAIVSTPLDCNFEYARPWIGG